jgi:uncharacterized RDD family membrane protein YckC
VKRRIIIWASAGLLVASCWTLYAFATAPDYEIPLTSTERVVHTLACVTCPIVLAGVYFYWVIIANAATYALIGLIVEMLRRKFHPAK